MSVTNGIVLIDKPSGITSFNVVSRIKRMFNTKKVGHAGTLDPLATGLLPILINKATKVQELIQNADKEYIAEFCLGLTTDTQDITGSITNKYDGVINVSKKELNNVLLSFKGAIQQTPPMYSAISKNGVRLYNLARRGVEVKREKRNVKINRLELLDFDNLNKTGKILVNCSKGTYIRTLCADIGEQLGCGATLTNLRRTKTCNFSIDESISLDTLENLKKSGKENAAIISLEKVFNYYRVVFWGLEQEKMFRNGRKFNISLDINDVLSLNSKECLLKVFNKDNIFLGLGKYSFENRIFSVYKLLV